MKRWKHQTKLLVNCCDLITEFIEDFRRINKTLNLYELTFAVVYATIKSS